MRTFCRLTGLAALLLLLVCGCQTLHRYRPVTVLVRDAETKKPIAGASVDVTYAMARGPFVPYESLGTTEESGVAHLRAAPFEDSNIQLEVTAKGYLTVEKDLLAQEIAAIEPAGWFEAVERRPENFVVELYAGPGPTVELVVPVGYRGPVKVEIQAKEDVPCPPGQRCFRCVVPASGSAKLVGPILLRRVYAPDFRGSYADGRPLSRTPKDDEVGLWWLKWDNDVHFFLVGTHTDYLLRRRSPQFRNAADQSFPSGRSQGGGGRGRHGRGGGGGGGQSSPDGTPY